MTKIMIELFSGSKVMSETFKKNGYDVFTIDFNKKLKPDLVVNILDFDISMLPDKFKSPEVIWSSPPCTTFSIASLGHYWLNMKPRRHETYIGLAIAKKNLEIIEQLNPKYWFIENPLALLRHQSFMLKLPRVSLNYCQYGEDSQKPTDIWTNSGFVPRPRCKSGDNCHVPAPRGSKTGTQGKSCNFTRSKIPIKLCEEIANVCERKTKIIQGVLQ